MSKSATTFTTTLNTGAKFPLLGLGTYSPDNRELFTEAVRFAIEDAGYRHIDTARVYKCEKEIGEGLKKVFANGKIKREDIFITTKVWGSAWNRVEESIDNSLRDLGTDYLDLVLVHWPQGYKTDDIEEFSPKNPDGSFALDPDGTFVNFWKNLVDVYKRTNKVKAIGVSNVSIKYFETLFAAGTDVVPAVNQVENSPRLPQQELLEYCKSKGIVLTAYSPFGGPGAPVLKDPTIVKLAEKYNTNPGSILVSFQIKRGVAVIPKSLNHSRLQANAEFADLSDEDQQTILDLWKGHPERHCKMPWGSILGFDDWTTD